MDFFVIPYSTLIIFSINICIVLIGSLIFRLTTNINRLEAQEFEVHKYEKDLKVAHGKADKATLRKLKREELRIKRISASVSRQRLKVIMITFLPFMTVSILLSMLYGGKEVALFPFEFILFDKNYSFSVWYFLSYLAAYLPLSKVFRSTPSLWQSSTVKSG